METLPSNLQQEEPVNLSSSVTSSSDEDEDDYQLENSDVVKRAVENSKFVVISDSDCEIDNDAGAAGIDLIDLTND